MRLEERERVYGAPHRISCMVDHPHVIDIANMFLWYRFFQISTRAIADVEIVATTICVKRG